MTADPGTETINGLVTAPTSGCVAPGKGLLFVSSFSQRMRLRVEHHSVEIDGIGWREQ
jgi:hypothetical protein